MPTRTTLTLDDDVAARLQREARRSGRAFRAVVNEALRVGLEASLERATDQFRVEPWSSGGLRDGLSLDSISQLLEQVEGPARA